MPEPRVLALLCLLAVGGFYPAASQDGAVPEGTRLRLYFTEGLGYEAETGAPGSLVVKEHLFASDGRFSGSVDISSKKGVASGNYSALIDSAGLQFAYKFSLRKPTGLSLDAQLRYRELFEDAWELRYGGTLRDRWGPGIETKGIFGDWALGFEGVRTAIQNLPIALYGGNPLLRLDVGWRFSARLTADAAIESFSEEDATYFPRTSFDFGARLELASLALRCRVMIKYTDFTTPTGYIDGYALRLAATIRLKGR